VLQLERSVTARSRTSRSTTYWITSFPPGRLSAAQLLQHVRDRWGIENSCFYVRDVTLKEDRCRLRTGHAAHNFSTARNAAIAFLKLTGHQSVAPVLRQHLYTPTVLIRKINY
jgi:predicted transposase YbfD/YdcC